MRIFAPICDFNWEENNLIQGLKLCGHDVVVFDWMKKGFSQYSAEWDYKNKKIMNDLLMKIFLEEHKKEPFHIMFSYLSDPNTYRWVIEAIKNECVYTINYSCNNIKSFERTHLNIGSAFDMNFHAERDIGNKFDKIHAKHLWFPFAVNLKYYHAIRNMEIKYDVSFVGQLYGYRLMMMAQLPNYGHSIGMASKIDFNMLKDYTYQSKITAGFKGLGNASFNDIDSKQIRLRDVEVPAMAGLHLTEYVPELEWYYDLENEVIPYKTMEDFYYKVDELCDSTFAPERMKIKSNARRRTEADHTWEIRFKNAFKEIGII